MNTETKKAILKKTIDVRATLLSIPESESVVIKTRDIKTNVVRACISRLNSEGYSFESTEKGLIDSIKVTRNK